MSNIKTPLKLLVTIGTTFFENEHPCVVTRVTDLDFDTLDKETRAVTVRNLRAWESERFLNSISAVAHLLKLENRTKENRKEYDERLQR